MILFILLPLFFLPNNGPTENKDLPQGLVSEAAPKNVLDYYYLLPEDPYFDKEAGKDSKEARQAGIKYQNISSGYLIGGHNWGPSFTMALFKNRTAGIDYIMAQRVRYPGDMFEGFFEFLEYTDDQQWVSANLLLPDISQYQTTLDDYEAIIPIIPEKGTVIKYVKWDHDEHDSDDTNYEEDGIFLFAYKWNGQAFELIQ
jgi:hypothetical protein